MIVLTNEWTKQAMARAVPGARYDDEHEAWIVEEVTPRAAAVILKLFPQLGLEHPHLQELRGELLKDVRPFDNATPYATVTSDRVDCPTVREVLERKGWALHEYQEVDLLYGAAILRAHGAFYMGWERGLGKTLGTCALIEDLGCRTTLVVAPNTAKDSVWAEALAEFLPNHMVLTLPNAKAQRERLLAALKGYGDEALDDKPLVLIVHYEALAIIAGKGKTKSGRTSLGEGWKHLGIEWDLLVTDEDHRLSNTGTQMARAAYKVPSKMRLQLSGSIIQNHLEELYSPLHRAFPDRYKSRWRDWNDRYLEYVNNGYAQICVGVQQHRVAALREELGVFMVYRRKEDELDLPPKTYVERRLEISPAQRKAYDQLVNECLTQLDDGTTIKSDDGIGMMTKLRQIATGLDLVEGSVDDSTKLDAAVEDILDSADDDFVVFSWYRAAVTALAERLEAKGVECFCVTGDTSHKVRAELIKRFQAGEGRVFIGTLSTLGESVNLQRANQVIRLDRSWNPALNVQAEDRVFRQGQTRNVTITDYIAKDTVDELNVLPTLANKAALRAAILGGA